MLDHMATLILVFWGASIVFSIVTVPTYSPTNSVRRKNLRLEIGLSE